MGLSHFSYRLKRMAIDAHSGGHWLRSMRRARQQMRWAGWTTVLAVVGMLMALGAGCHTDNGGCRKATPFDQALERASKQPPTIRTLTITVDGQSQSFPIILPGTNITVEIH